MNELLSLIGVDSSDTRIVRGMHEDSRKVSEDWLFLARSGMRGNGKEHVQEALAHGAAVLMEEQCDLEGVYICEDLSKAQIILGKALYPDLCEGMLCIGVTGTSGKSSTSAFLYQMLSAAMPCVRIGTHQVSGAGWEEEIANTTPPLCELIRLIEMARARQVRCVIMEVSSHAIAEKRIALLRFDHLIYTNIREDHLDFHHCAAHYRYTKYALRHYLKPGGQVIVNHDDPGLRQLCSLLDGHCTTFGHVASHFQIVKERCERSGIHFTVNEYVCHAALYGRFQVMNIVPALIVARQLGFSRAWIEAKVAELRPLKDSSIMPIPRMPCAGCSIRCLIYRMSGSSRSSAAAGNVSKRNVQQSRRLPALAAIFASSRQTIRAAKRFHRSCCRCAQQPARAWCSKSGPTRSNLQWKTAEMMI